MLWEVVAVVGVGNPAWMVQPVGVAYAAVVVCSPREM